MAWDDVFDPPKGFQLVGNDATPPTFDPPQGFQLVGDKYRGPEVTDFPRPQADPYRVQRQLEDMAPPSQRRFMSVEGGEGPRTDGDMDFVYGGDAVSREMSGQGVLDPRDTWQPRGMTRPPGVPKRAPVFPTEDRFPEVRRPGEADPLWSQHEDEQKGKSAPPPQQQPAPPDQNFPQRYMPGNQTPRMQPEQRAGGWRGLLDAINPIGTAEAKTSKKKPDVTDMDEWPATEEEFKTKYGREPQTEVEKKFYASEEPPIPSWRDSAGQQVQPPLENWGEDINVPEKLAKQGNYDPKLHRLGPDGPIPYSEGWRGMLERATEPLNPHVWGRNIKEEWHEGTEQEARGMNRIVGERGGGEPRNPGQTRRGQIVQGVGDVGLGALRAGTAPLTGMYHSVVSDPVQRTTGLPRWASDLGMLAIPGIGIPRAPGFRVPSTGTTRGILPEAMGGPGVGKQVTDVPNWAQNQYVQRALPGVPGAAAQPHEVSAFRQAGQPGGLTSAGEKIFSPETAQLSANDAANIAREFGGMGARETAQAAHSLEKFYPATINMPDQMRVLGTGDAWKTSASGIYKGAKDQVEAEQWNLQNYIDGGKSAVAPADPEMKAMADQLRKLNEKAKADLQAMPQGMQKQFREKFFVHYWKDDVAPDLEGMAMAGRGGRQGSLASLEGRKYDTLEDGLKAGKIPKWSNPLEAQMRYLASVSKAKMWNNILEEGKNMGMVVRGEHEPVGGSGAGGSRTTANDQDWYTRTILDGKLRGYVELDGRGGRGWFAPEGFARVYNNAIMSGFEATDVGPFVEALRKASNGATQTLLSFSGYHAMTITEAAMNTNIARAVRNLKEGDYAKGVAHLGSTPLSIVPYAYRGKHWTKVYLEPNAAGITDHDREVMDMLVRGGDRVGSKHALDIGSSKMDNWIQAMKKAGGWQQGAQGSWQGMKQIGRNIRQPFREAGGGLKGTAASFASTLGQTMDTVNHGLFNVLIPSVKTGIKGELMSDFLKANPLATDAQKVAEGRRLADSIDNRFGEMMQDNIFWNRMIKQAATVSMLSYSWNVGGWREVMGGGVRDIARAAMGTGAWSPKATYTVAMAANQAMIATMYQKLKTGQYPWEGETPYTDLMAPRTGGTMSVYNPDTGKREEQPARLLIPGLHKDIFGFYEHPMQEAGNKLNVLMKTAWGAATNSGWDVGPNDPVFNPMTGINMVRGKGGYWKILKDEGAKSASTPEERKLWDNIPVWMGNAYDYIERSMMPISFQQQMGRGKAPAGSGLTWEAIPGGRLAPSQFQNPYHERTQKMFEQQRYNEYMTRKLRKDERLQEREEKYRGPD